MEQSTAKAQLPHALSPEVPEGTAILSSPELVDGVSGVSLPLVAVRLRMSSWTRKAASRRSSSRSAVFLGLGEKNVSVPFQALRVTQKDNKGYLVMNTTKDALKSAPGYKYDRRRRCVHRRVAVLECARASRYGTLCDERAHVFHHRLSID